MPKDIKGMQSHVTLSPGNHKATQAIESKPDDSICVESHQDTCRSPVFTDLYFELLKVNWEGRSCQDGR